MVTLRAVEEERNESFKRNFIVQNAGAAINAWRQQIGNVSVAIRPYAMETAEAAEWWFIGNGSAV